MIRDMRFARPYGVATDHDPYIRQGVSARAEEFSRDASTLWRNCGLRGQALREAHLVVQRIELGMQCPDPMTKDRDRRSMFLAEIISAILQAGGRATVKQLCEATGASKNKVRHVLDYFPKMFRADRGKKNRAFMVSAAGMEWYGTH